MPEAVVFLFHALHEGIDAHVPVHIVGIWDKHGSYGTCVVTILLTHFVAIQCTGNGGGVEHQLFPEHAGETVHRAYLWDSKAKTGLLPVLQLTEQG